MEKVSRHDAIPGCISSEIIATAAVFPFLCIKGPSGDDGPIHPQALKQTCLIPSVITVTAARRKRDLTGMR